MNDLSTLTDIRRFWALLIGLSVANGALAMAAYALLYGYFRWPDMLDESLPFGGLEFLLIVTLIGAANLLLIGRLYGFRASDAPWLDRNSRPKSRVIIVGVASMLFGGLGTVHLIRALTDGMSIFDRGGGYIVGLLLTVALTLLVTAPALLYGEWTLRNNAGGGSGSGVTPSSP